MHLLDRVFQEKIIEVIIKFYQDVLSTFPNESCNFNSLLYYSFTVIFDIYIDKSYKVWLIDFGIFGTADPILFSYPDLMDIFESEIPLSIRVVQSESLKPKTMSYGFPSDIMDLSTSNGIEKFAENYQTLDQ